MEICAISDLAFVVELGQLSSRPEPSTNTLHLGKFVSVLDECHSEDLSFNVIIQELVTLQNQMVINRVVLVDLLMTVVQFFARLQAKICDGLGWKPP